MWWPCGPLLSHGVRLSHHWWGVEGRGCTRERGKRGKLITATKLNVTVYRKSCALCIQSNTGHAYSAMWQRHTDMKCRQCSHPPPQMWQTSKWKGLHHFPPKFLHSRVAISCNGNFAVFPQSSYSGVLLQVLIQEVLCILLICIVNSCCNVWWNDSFVLQL